jgi:hypothetical protein
MPSQKWIIHRPADVECTPMLSNIRKTGCLRLWHQCEQNQGQGTKRVVPETPRQAVNQSTRVEDEASTRTKYVCSVRALDWKGRDHRYRIQNCRRSSVFQSKYYGCCTCSEVFAQVT